MGSAVSISDKFAVNKDEVASEESHSSTEDPSSTSSSLFLQTPISSTLNVLSFMRQSRFYQNYDTNEVILILGSDNIEHIPNIDRSEWHEVQLSDKFASSTSSFLEAPISSTLDVLIFMRQSRLYQSYDTNEVILILGSDNIEHISNIDRSEWHEVQLSGQQEAYLSRSQQLPQFQKESVLLNQTSNGTSHKVDLTESSLASNSKSLSPIRTTKSNKPLLPLVPLLRSLVLQI